MNLPSLSLVIYRSYAFFKPLKDVREYQDKKEDFDPNKPLQFSTSPAAKWNVRSIRLEVDPIMDAPWYKAIIWIAFGMGSLYYLNFYRQGNDLDDEFEMPLGKRVLQIREMQTNQDRNHALLEGRSTKQYDDALEEIKRLRKKYKYDEDD